MDNYFKKKNTKQGGSYQCDSKPGFLLCEHPELIHTT